VKFLSNTLRLERLSHINYAGPDHWRLSTGKSGVQEQESCETRLFTKCPSHRILNTAEVLSEGGGRKKNNFHKTQISGAHKWKGKQTDEQTQMFQRRQTSLSCQKVFPKNV